jgi:quinoprotein glucose dehydrogenase
MARPLDNRRSASAVCAMPSPAGRASRRRLAAALFVLTAIAAGGTAWAVDETPLAIEAELAFPNLSIHRPVFLTHAGDGSPRVFVIAQLGKIHVFPNNRGIKTTKIFLDIEPRTYYKDKENEQGLLGLAFHPKYKQNGQFFVCYTTTDAPLTTVISRFRVSKTDPDRADPASEEELLRLTRPYWNHCGGTVVFGPDGYLYVALGDGGLANDPHGNGQNLTTLLGKILRIDVDHQESGRKYAIPKDNPFAGGPDGARGEIWAYGLRNVWRMSFDRQTGTLWAGDVGQDLWEEIDLIVRGGNYGWKLREARHKFQDGSDPRPDLIEPIWEYHHDVGKSITGGHVYRGKRLPQLYGLYLYADYVAGKLWALRYDERKKEVVANYSLRGEKAPVMSFGEDEAGEVYFLTEFGKINRFKAVAK